MTCGLISNSPALPNPWSVPARPTVVTHLFSACTPLFPPRYNLGPTSTLSWVSDTPDAPPSRRHLHHAHPVRRLVSPLISSLSIPRVTRCTRTSCTYTRIGRLKVRVMNKSLSVSNVYRLSNRRVVTLCAQYKLLTLFHALRSNIKCVCSGSRACPRTPYRQSRGT